MNNCITVQQILKETSEIIKEGNGSAISCIKRFKSLRQSNPGIKEQLNQAIYIIQEIINLREEVAKTNSVKVKNKLRKKIFFYSLGLFFLIFSIYLASANIRFVGNRIIVEDMQVNNLFEVLGDGINFQGKFGKDIFSFYTSHAGIGDVPEAFDDSLILQTDDISNPYNMEFCWWDNENEIMTFCSNEGAPNRATTFRRSFQIVGNVTDKENDMNFTLCEGNNYVDCNTDETGADLLVQDDIEAGGSIYSNESIQSNSLKGNYINGEANLCVYNNGTIFAKDTPCI